MRRVYRFLATFFDSASEKVRHYRIVQIPETGNVRRADIRLGCYSIKWPVCCTF